MTEFVQTEIFGIRLYQKKHGWKFSQDSVLLVRFFLELESGYGKKGEKKLVLDVGTGCGVIPILIDKWSDSKFQIFAIDIDNEFVKISKINFRENAAEAFLLNADIRFAPFKMGSFDVIISNPPYIPPEEGKISQKYDIAKWEISFDLKTFAKVSAYLLRDKGRLYTVYPSWRLGEVLGNFFKSGLKPVFLQFFHHSQTLQSDIFFIACRKSVNEKLKVLPPIFKDVK